MAAQLTRSQQAYVRVLADDNLRDGDSRDCHDKMAARVGTCSRTIQRAQNRIERLGWIEVERRPVEGQKHDTNIVRIVSPELLTWMLRGPSPLGRQKRRATENQLFSRAIEMLDRRKTSTVKPAEIDPGLKATLDRLETAIRSKENRAAPVAPQIIRSE
jgi:hypothetical protein